METTIDITPTWKSAMRIYLELWTHLDADGQQGALKELLRCADLADKYVDLIKENT